jgi:hypothetical protein
VVFRRQLPSPEHGGCSGGSGEPIKVFGKLQDRFLRAGIGQLRGHLPRLLGAVEPLEGFIQNRWHFGPPSIALCRIAPFRSFIWASECLRAEARGSLLTILHEQSRLMKRQKVVLLAEGQTRGRVGRALTEEMLGG